MASRRSRYRYRPHNGLRFSGSFCQLVTSWPETRNNHFGTKTTKGDLSRPSRCKEKFALYLCTSERAHHGATP
jgi:hypothetical protein